MPTIANHLLQSTVFAVAAGLLTLLLRNNHARTRYWIWLTASLKFLIPFSLFVELGHHLSWPTAPVIAQQPSLAIAIDTISQPFAAPGFSPTTPVHTATATPSTLPTLLLAVWICGLASVLIF
jgi:bla regulator protein blaR1